MATLGLIGSEFFSSIILPFLLIFTVVFAILDKTKFLGEKKDINAIVALVFGLVTVGVPWAIGVVLNIIPIVAVIVIILIAWLMTYGFVSYEKGQPLVSAAWKKTFQILLGIAFVGSIVWATGLYKVISSAPWAGQIGQTVFLVGVVIAIIAIVISGKPEKSD